MCGFVATITPRSGHLLGHRGPDGIGGGDALLPWGSVHMEMARLAIVDQRTIPVPFDFRESAGVVLAYNGEIYNWRALRAELSDGRPWQTDCDAEVLSRAWRAWGPECLNRLNGMFAFVLVDTIKGEVFAARDRAGEKPLYYARHGMGIALSSEIKALPVELREAPCPEMEALEFDCTERTPFAGVFALAPGHFLHFRSPERLAAPLAVEWWRWRMGESDTATAKEEDLAESVADAIRLRAKAEVPVSVQLSGGLDSAIIQVVARSDRAYTVALDGMDDYFARIANRGDATAPIRFALSDLLGALPKIAYHLDTPATWTAVCQWFMNQRIREDGAIIVLSGEGADELFGGYTRYRILWHLERMRTGDPSLGPYLPLVEHMTGARDEILARMLNRGGPSTMDTSRALVDRFARGDDLVTRMQRVEFYTTMQVLLRMADRMSAAFGMENRSPFLDYRVMEFAASVPVEQRVDANWTKAILRRVAERLGVPGSIVNEKTKRGLSIPWSKWNGATGSRGAWDRSTFATLMRETWRRTFFGGLEV